MVYKGDTGDNVNPRKIPVQTRTVSLSYTNELRRH